VKYTVAKTNVSGHTLYLALIKKHGTFLAFWMAKKEVGSRLFFSWTYSFDLEDAIAWMAKLEDECHPHELQIVEAYR
jgi:hypothetical protein